MQRQLCFAGIASRQGTRPGTAALFESLDLSKEAPGPGGRGLKAGAARHANSQLAKSSPHETALSRGHDHIQIRGPAAQRVGRAAGRIQYRFANLGLWRARIEPASAHRKSGSIESPLSPAAGLPENTLAYAGEMEAVDSSPPCESINALDLDDCWD
jgi:hypothetical protein